MSLKCGIVGLPNVGKSTLFNCLSQNQAKSENFPFCTIEPNVGVIEVPDPRLDKIAELYQPKKVIPTAIEMVDIAGLVQGASEGEGLGNQFLANIRETDAIVHVLRCFEDDNIAHVDGSVDPVRDKEVIDAELQLKDLETVENRLQKAEKEAKSGSKESKQLVDLLHRLKGALESGKSVRTVDLNEEEEKMVKELQLLTRKPVLYCCNVEEASAANGNEKVKEVEEAVKDEGARVITVAAGAEAEIAQLEDEDRREFLKDLGLEEAGVDKLIRESYALLDLCTFFTAGEPEVRAWTVKKGSSAPEAAGVIHSDFQRGFIKAEVIKYEDLLAYGSEQAVKDAGKMAMEGKGYIVKDGDIIHFRFNV